MNKTELLDQLKTDMKSRGFRKSRTTWRKDLGDIIAVFNVQTSQWGTADYYINLGVYLRCLGEHSAPPEYKCHVRTRIEHEGRNTRDIVGQAMRRFDQRSTVSAVRSLAPAASSRGLVMKEVFELPT
jgi:hypothetical protein